AAACQLEIVDDGRRERMLLVEDGRGREGRQAGGQGRRPRKAVASGIGCGLESGERVGQSTGRVIVVVDVVVDTGNDAGGTQLLEPAVETLAGRAIVLVRRIAQRHDG